MMRRFKITNCYELHDTVIVEKDIDVPDPLPGESIDDYIARIDDDGQMYEHTGVGNFDGNSGYEMVTIDGLEPRIFIDY